VRARSSRPFTLQLYDVAAIAAAVVKEASASTSGKPAERKGAGGESKGKGDGKQKASDRDAPGTQALADKVAKQLPRDAKSEPAFDAAEDESPLPLAAVIRRVIVSGARV
jgi:hypothetical protein